MRRGFSFDESSESKVANLIKLNQNKEVLHTSYKGMARAAVRGFNAEFSCEIKGTKKPNPLKFLYMMKKCFFILVNI